MTPTGSWPMVRPGATGYSPLRMCTSVPQIVVVVMRSRASLGPISGMGLSCSSMRPGSTNTAAFIMTMVRLLFELKASGHSSSALRLASDRSQAEVDCLVAFGLAGGCQPGGASLLVGGEVVVNRLARALRSEEHTAEL